jgi:hypothetical protein
MRGATSRPPSAARAPGQPPTPSVAAGRVGRVARGCRDGCRPARGVRDGRGRRRGAGAVVRGAGGRRARLRLRPMPASAQRNLVRGCEQDVLRDIADTLTAAGRQLPVLALEYDELPPDVVDGSTTEPLRRSVSGRLLDQASAPPGLQLLRGRRAHGGPACTRARPGFQVEFVGLQRAPERSAHVAARLGEILRGGQPVIWVGPPSLAADVDSSFLERTPGAVSTRERPAAGLLTDPAPDLRPAQVRTFVIGYEGGPDDLLPSSITRINGSTSAAT